MKIYVIIGHMSFRIRTENHFREIRDEWREPNEENHPWNKESAKTTKKDDSNGNFVMFRLTPTAEVNEHWKVKARIEAKDYLQTDTSGSFSVKRLWAEGTYGNTKIQLGKFHPYVDTELIMDNVISGRTSPFPRRTRSMPASKAGSSVRTTRRGTIFRHSSCTPTANLS